MGNKKNSTIKFLVLVLIIFNLIFFVYYFNLTSYLSQEMIGEKLEMFGIFAPVFFILIYALATIFFIPGTILTISSGVFFGTFLGTTYTIIGATIGAMGAFLTAKFFGKEFMEQNLNKKFPKLGSYNDDMDKKGFSVNLFLRIIPIFPFNGLNYALGLTKIKNSHYFFSTFLGIIPGSFVLAYFGSSLSSLNLFHIVLSSLLFLSLMAVYPIYKKVKK